MEIILFENLYSKNHFLSKTLISSLYRGCHFDVKTKTGFENKGILIQK